MIRTTPKFNVIKAEDLPGPYQFVNEATLQDELIYRKGNIVANVQDQTEACIRAFDPAITKTSVNDFNACSVSGMIEYIPVLTPFIVRMDKCCVSQYSSNFSQNDLYILSTWLQPHVYNMGKDLEIVYFSRSYQGERRMILVLMRGSVVYQISKKEAEKLKILVDKYAFKSQALLLDININNLIYSAHWLNSVLPFTEFEYVDNQVYINFVDDNVEEQWETAYNNLMDTLKYMYDHGYIVVIPSYHDNMIRNWKLVGSNVSIEANSENMILCYPDWEDIRFAGSMLQLMERQFSGEHYIELKVENNDVIRHLLAVELYKLKVDFMYQEDMVIAQCDNLNLALNIADLVDIVRNYYSGSVTLNVNNDKAITYKVMDKIIYSVHYDFG